MRQRRSRASCSRVPRDRNPGGFLNTMDDVKTMLVEQNVSLWVSLAPVVENNVSIEYLTSMLRTHTLKCNMFPFLLMLDHGDESSRSAPPAKTIHYYSSPSSYLLRDIHRQFTDKVLILERRNAEVLPPHVPNMLDVVTTQIQGAWRKVCW